MICSFTYEKINTQENVKLISNVFFLFREKCHLPFQLNKINFFRMSDSWKISNWNIYLQEFRNLKKNGISYYGHYLLSPLFIYKVLFFQNFSAQKLRVLNTGTIYLIYFPVKNLIVFRIGQL